MLGRQDAENIYVMFSDHLHFWDTMQLILEPKFPWEFIQLGKLRLTHRNRGRLARNQPRGGAHAKVLHRRFPVDRDDPTKVIAGCLNH